MLKQILASCLCVSAFLFASAPSRAEAPKEWTLLVYMNGFNNLDSWALDDMLDLERAGSSDRINVVVQWADMASKKIRRYYITKSADPQKVTSPLIEELPKVDMGDWRTVVDFVRWGTQHYPAQHYMIDIWDHGTGWHPERTARAGRVHVGDISHDETTNHWINTKELGWILAESARIIGHKVEIYASDACLMGMIEVASQMKDYVDVYIGSEVDIPVQGFPYEGFLNKWASMPGAAPAQIARMLATEYITFFHDAKYAKKGATLSVFDLSQTAAMHEALAALAQELSKLDPAARKKGIEALISSTSFTNDYSDLLDFVSELEKAQIKGIESETLAHLRKAASSYILSAEATKRWRKTNGVSIWIPDYAKWFNLYLPQYKELTFSKETHWEDGIRSLLR